MTAPKHGPRRLGFRDGTEVPERHLYRRTEGDIQRYAQWIWLGTIARLVPDVLRTLDEIPAKGGASGNVLSDLQPELAEPDEVALEGWGRRWHLADFWCLAHARATWRHWRLHPAATRTYWLDRDDLTGRLTEAPTPSAPRPLKKVEHFEWLVAFQCKEQPCSKIASHDAQIVHEAIQRLAKYIGLTLRVSRGRPRKSPR